jgi:hypothetical protein
MIAARIALIWAMVLVNSASDALYIPTGPWPSGALLIRTAATLLEVSVGVSMVKVMKKRDSKNRPSPEKSRRRSSSTSCEMASGNRLSG